ncbi:hypothetical protein CI610_00089 [invertebrate metagenome]|uniref:Beta-barrel assembly-enhancing protease n=1 Tax=invertebrate metagenome TaxID=1711999 RepID=A0A2H9TCF4_9ZZZZ
MEGTKQKPITQRMERGMRLWLFSQASCYIEYQQSDKAIVLLEAMRRLEPENCDVHRMLSYGYLQVGKSEESIRAADTFLKYAKPGTDTRAIRWIRGRARLRRKKQAANSQAINNT